MNITHVFVKFTIVIKYFWTTLVRTRSVWLVYFTLTRNSKLIFKNIVSVVNKISIHKLYDVITRLCKKKKKKIVSDLESIKAEIAGQSRLLSPIIKSFLGFQLDAIVRGLFDRHAAPFVTTLARVLPRSAVHARVCVVPI